MNFSKLSKTFKKISNVLDKNLPAILTGVGAVGSVTGAVLAAKAGIKTSPMIKEIKEQHIKENITGVKAVTDTVVTVGKYYIPAGLVTATSVACIIGAHKINSKRILALSSALIASKDQFKDYRSKVKEIIGDKKEEKINTETVAEQIEKQLTYLPWDKLIEGEGPVVYCDINTGKLWKSDPIKMTNYINEFNKLVNNDPFDEPHNIGEWYDMFEGVRTIPFITKKMLISTHSYGSAELPDLDRMTVPGPCIGGFAICYLDYGEYILDNGR